MKAESHLQQPGMCPANPTGRFFGPNPLPPVWMNFPWPPWRWAAGEPLQGALLMALLEGSPRLMIPQKKMILPAQSPAVAYHHLMARAANLVPQETSEDQNLSASPEQSLAIAFHHSMAPLAQASPWPEMLLEIPVMAGNRLRQQAILLLPPLAGNLATALQMLASPWPEMLQGIPVMVEIQES